MTKKSLKKRIDDLVDALGAGTKPTFPEIRSDLVRFGAEAEALENSQALAEKDARIANLEAALEKTNVELRDLNVSLEKANSELEAFTEEQEERGKQDAELPDIQFQILKRLPLVNQHGQRLDRIAWDAGITLDEAEIHLDALCKRKPQLARRQPAWPWTNETGWKRTMAGNRYVVAKRLAGEEEQQTYRYPDLPDVQHKALLLIAEGMGGGASESDVSEKLGTTFGATRYGFNALRERDFAADPYDHPQRPTADRTFYLRATGAEYLAERNLL